MTLMISVPTSAECKSYNYQMAELVWKTDSPFEKKIYDLTICKCGTSRKCLKIFYYFYSMCMSVLPVCMKCTCVVQCPQRPEDNTDPLELEFQMIVRCHVSAGTRVPSLHPGACL